MSDRIIVAYFLVEPNGHVTCGSCGRWAAKFNGKGSETKAEIEDHVSHCPHLNQMRRDLEPFVVTVPKEVS